MKSALRVVLCLGVVAGISGCIVALSGVGGASFVAAEPASADKALIYFYRPIATQGGVVTIDILDGGLPIVSIKNGQFVGAHATPGKHSFITETGADDQGVVFDVEAGKTYFVRCDIRQGTRNNTLSLSRVDPESALAELKLCCRAGGQCATDQHEKQYCSKPDGGAMKDGNGAVVCGAGECVMDDEDRVWCSKEPGGSAGFDSRKLVKAPKCTGGCELASAGKCEVPK